MNSNNTDIFYKYSPINSESYKNIESKDTSSIFSSNTPKNYNNNDSSEIIKKKLKNINYYLSKTKISQSSRSPDKSLESLQEGGSFPTSTTQDIPMNSEFNDPLSLYDSVIFKEYGISTSINSYNLDDDSTTDSSITNSSDGSSPYYSETPPNESTSNYSQTSKQCKKDKS